MGIINIPGLYANIKDTPFVARLHAALERKINIALILGLIDDIGRIRDMHGLVSCDDSHRTPEARQTG